MVDLIFADYWSKSDAFLLPLTGLRKEYEHEMKSYLFWEDYSIVDYKLILTFTYEDYDKFKQFCKDYIFPKLDIGVLLVENYDYMGRAIFILDMSEWAFDIDMFLYGKYSKFSKEAKNVIERFHRSPQGKIKCYLYSALHPQEKQSLLGDLNALDYLVQNYEFDSEVVHRNGEIGGIYDKNNETLLTHTSQLC